jgi:hypothetical protein
MFLRIHLVNLRRKTSFVNAYSSERYSFAFNNFHRIVFRGFCEFVVSRRIWGNCRNESRRCGNRTDNREGRSTASWASTLDMVLLHIVFDWPNSLRMSVSESSAAIDFGRFLNDADVGRPSQVTEFRAIFKRMVHEKK